MLPVAFAAWAHLLRMATISWSGQSFSTLFSRYRLAPRGQRVEEALPVQGDPSCDPGVGQEVAGPGDGAGEVDQDAGYVGMAAQQRGEHGAGAASDIDHGADRGSSRRMSSMSKSGMPGPAGPLSASKSAAMFGWAVRSSQNGCSNTVW